MLSVEEQAVIETVAEWVDREVKPVVNELAIPEPWGEAAVSMSLAGAMGGHTVVAKLLLEFGTKARCEPSRGRNPTAPTWSAAPRPGSPTRGARS
jgi:hypothetical protein